MKITALVSFMHIPCLFACFYVSVPVSCVWAFFSTCPSTCVAHDVCFVFCSIFITTFLFYFFFSYRFNRHLCHGTYWCTHNPAHMPILLFHLRRNFSNSCVCVSKHVYTFPCSSIHKAYTFFAVFICMFCVLSYIYKHLLVFFLPFLQI